MKITGFRKRLIVAGLAAAMFLAGTGCTENKLTSTDPVTSATQQSVDPLSFTAIDAKFREFTFSINEYMKEHQAETTQKKTAGETPNGFPAQCQYTISPDKKFESLQMEKNLPNGVQVDEYFNLGDSIFIARTTVYNDGNYDPVDKYYIIDGVIYKVDTLAETVTKVIDINDPNAPAKKKELDIFFSFDEIRPKYA